MTALKPTDDRRVRGVAAVRYTGNTVCGHPECAEPVESYHHIFPRSLTGNGSWYVAFTDRTDAETIITKDAIPHVIGLCGTGTTGHHGDLEEHRAWIKLEDGVFSWFDRVESASGWLRIGPLNPQPGNAEGKPKRKRRASTPEERKARVNTTIRTPKDEENVLPELIDVGREAWKDELGWSDSVPDYYVVAVAFGKALQ